MKVTRVETRCVTVKLDKPIGSALGQLHSFGCILVFVHCDSGVVGENLIFTLNARRTRVLQSMVEEMADLIIGRDAGHIAGFWARAWRDINFLGHKGVPVVGISALDGALWDALGKMSNLPLYRILGGAQDRVPVYHSGGLWLSSSGKELVAEAERFAAAGFRAMKMRLGSPEPATDAARVRAVRTAIGPKIKLMADANQGLTENQAIRLGRALEEFDLTWFEEPLPAWDLDGLARVAAALDTPIASGETEYTRYGFRRMLELRSADILMPDLQRDRGSHHRIHCRTPGAQESDQHLYVLSTLALALMIQQVVAVEWSTEPQAFPRVFGIGGGGILDEKFWLPVLTCAVTICALELLYRRTLMGLAFLAIAEDNFAARALGLPERNLRMASYALAGMIGGLAGFSGGQLLLAFVANGPLLNFYGFVPVALGGLGNNRGAIVGGFALGLFQQAANFLVGGIFSSVAVFMLFIVVLLAAPRGLFGGHLARRV